MVQLLVDCNSVSMKAFFIVVKRAMLIIQIFVPIILIVFATISIIKLINDPEQKDGVKKVINRFLAAAIVFFVPLLVDVMMNMIGDNSISSCWKNATDKVQQSSGYSKVSDRPLNTIFIDPSEYEKGVPRGNGILSKNKSNDIVFIGNSKTFGSDIPGLVNSIATNAGYKVNVTSIVEGGKTLYWHAANNASKISKKYDIAVLQEQTDVMERDLASYKVGAKQVANLLRSQNDKIGIYLRECWGLKANVGNYLHQQVETNAAEVAKSIDATLIRDGSSWDTYNNFDALYLDATHQNDAGAYLSAACIFKTISNFNLSKITYYANVDEKTAKEFLSIANSVCQ